ncbi:MAG: dUTP diphosphatase [bacterium]
MKIKIKKIHPDAKLPTYANPGDVGLDLYSLEEKIIQPGEHARFWNGFALEFPEGFAAIVKDKSSISKAGLHSMGGVFDAGYRGEYNVHLVNLTLEPIKIEKGQKVAQLVIFPVSIAELEEVENLSDSERGLGSFGSSGK